MYEFLKNETFNWRKFILNIATQLIFFFEKLTSTQREKVLIADDSLLTRPRSKMVELLSWVHDHKDNKHYKGYRFLSLCWSDGNSFLPLDFSLLVVCHTYFVAFTTKSFRRKPESRKTEKRLDPGSSPG